MVKPNFSILPKVVQTEIEAFYNDVDKIPSTRILLILQNNLKGTVFAWPPENFDVVIAVVDWLKQFPSYLQKINYELSIRAVRKEIENGPEPDHKFPQDSE